MIHLVYLFIVLLMLEFNAIFRMDWMSRHQALIDCKKRKVHLRLDKR